MPSYRKDLGEAHDIAKIYWGAMSESRMRAGLRLLRDSGDTTSFEGMDPDGPLPPFITADENLSAMVDGTELPRPQDGRTRRARHPDQDDGPFFALSNNVGATPGAWSSSGSPRASAGELNEDGLETDLFAGLG